MTTACYQKLGRFLFCAYFLYMGYIMYFYPLKPAEFLKLRHSSLMKDFEGDFGIKLPDFLQVKNFINKGVYELIVLGLGAQMLFFAVLVGLGWSEWSLALGLITMLITSIWYNPFGENFTTTKLLSLIQNVGLMGAAILIGYSG